MGASCSRPQREPWLCDSRSHEETGPTLSSAPPPRVGSLSSLGKWMRPRQAHRLVCDKAEHAGDTMSPLQRRDTCGHIFPYPTYTNSLLPVPSPGLILDDLPCRSPQRWDEQVKGPDVFVAFNSCSENCFPKRYCQFTKDNGRLHTFIFLFWSQICYNIIDIIRHNIALFPLRKKDSH